MSRYTSYPLTGQTTRDADVELSLRLAFGFQVFGQGHGPTVLNQHRSSPVDSQLARSSASRSMTARDARLCTSVKATTGRSGWWVAAQASAARPISVA